MCILSPPPDPYFITNVFHSPLLTGVLAFMSPCGIVLCLKELFNSESKSQVYGHLHDLPSMMELNDIGKKPLSLPPVDKSLILYVIMNFLSYTFTANQYLSAVLVMCHNTFKLMFLL